MSAKHFIIPVTIILASDVDEYEDDDQDEYFRSMKKKGRGSEQMAQETQLKSNTGPTGEDAKIKDPGDGGTGIAVATHEGATDPRLNGGADGSQKKPPPSQRCPGRGGRQRYTSLRAEQRAADQGRVCPKLSPSRENHSPEKHSAVKSEPGEAPRWGRARGGQEFRCEECSYSTNSSYNLACHARTHTGERPYGCPRCRLRFRTRSCLNRHVLARVCQRPAGGARPPKAEPKAEPEPPRALECADCGYCTPHAYNLKVHRRVHSDERPFPCAACDFAFRTQSHLYRHQRCHRSSPD